jgi:hypothetical protein
METTFARWLRERGETYWAYSQRLKLNQRGVERLIGRARKPLTITYFNHPFLAKVATDTGIPIGTLIEDTIKASANPIAPRAYTRKGAIEP